MSKLQFAVQMGFGTDLKGKDFTKAASRAVHDALHRNFLVIGSAFDLPLSEMIVDIRVGVTNPDRVDLNAIKALAPVGKVSVQAVHGGLEVAMMDEITIIANAIVTVSYDVEIIE